MLCSEGLGEGQMGFVANVKGTKRYSDLSARLGLSQDEGEKWIVNLIRDTRVDAKIDYKEVRNLAHGLF